MDSRSPSDGLYICDLFEYLEVHFTIPCCDVAPIEPIVYPAMPSGGRSNVLCAQRGHELIGYKSPVGKPVHGSAYTEVDYRYYPEVGRCRSNNQGVMSHFRYSNQLIFFKIIHVPVWFT